MNQHDLPFDPEESARRREEAIRRVESNADEKWKADAFQAVASIAREQSFLTTDDVWGKVSGDGTHEPRAMGAIMRQAASAELIEATERYEQSGRVACHRRPLRVWRSLVFRGAP